jgi:hypothetical protein
VGTFMRLGQDIKGGIRFGNSLEETPMTPQAFASS